MYFCISNNADFDLSFWIHIKVLATQKINANSKHAFTENDDNIKNKVKYLRCILPIFAELTKRGIKSENW